MINRALEIGIDMDDMHLEKIHLLQDLEVARHNLGAKKEEVVEEGAPIANGQVILLDWENDHIEQEDFTPVISRKTKKKNKSVVKVAPRSRSQLDMSNKTSDSASHKCEELPPTRNRKKKSKYL